MPRINASNDFFIRTSDPRHKERVQAFMQRIYDNGHVYKGLYEGWYCPRCADFKAENEIAEGNTCPIHRIPLDRENEENWFFRLSAFQEQLEPLYADRPDFVLPAAAVQRGALVHHRRPQDISLSRAKLTWGVEVPWDPAHVFYVWFDALLNYYTALSFGAGERDRTAELWPATLQIIAKDILKFHAVDLAGDAARRRRGAAAAAVHPRLPDDEGRLGRGREDVQVARQRARPVRGHGQVRHRRAALLLLPRGLLRPGRRRVARPASSRATRPSWPTTTATSPAARSR